MLYLRISLIVSILQFLFTESFGFNIQGDTINENGIIKVMHIGWENGRMPEFANAYTLHSHEVRLNVIGRSSFAFSNKLEMSIYLPLIITPNISFKFNFLDCKFLASAIEAGVAGGIFPVVAASGIIMPGGGVGGGTAGLLHGSDCHLKLIFSFPLNNKFTFSIRGSASTIHAGYWGGGAFAGLGGSDATVGLFPINVSKRFRFYAAGFDADYLIDKQNAVVMNSCVGGFEGAKKQLGLATLSWTHAKIHFHYTFGLYCFYDPPGYEMLHESKLPVSAYANVYWILNNGKKRH
ncbi:MAG: hypothetical protein NTW49_04500 [Bacteroidia bacterium]|nr:hypothetical protein [Bacteroidia bacterium]